MVATAARTGPRACPAAPSLLAILDAEGDILGCCSLGMGEEGFSQAGRLNTYAV